LFDMDGTLLRLEVDIEEARLRLASLFAPYGVTRPFRPILRRIGEAAGEAAARGGDAAALRARGLAILDELEVAAASSARPRPGAVAALAALAGQGAALAVVTDNGRACARPALAAAGFDPAVFSAIVTRDDVPAPKPDPAGIVAAARALGDAGEIWYVGDHPRDVEAARAAASSVPGLKVIAILGGHAAEKDLRAAGADRVLPDLAGLVAP
jgi:phosphoglycolate phosphatase